MVYKKTRGEKRERGKSSGTLVATKTALRDSRPRFHHERKCAAKGAFAVLDEIIRPGYRFVNSDRTLGTLGRGKERNDRRRAGQENVASCHTLNVGAVLIKSAL